MPSMPPSWSTCSDERRRPPRAGHAAQARRPRRRARGPCRGGEDGVHRGLPGSDHALRLGRDLDAVRTRPPHAQRDHDDRSHRARALRGARPARARGAAQRPDARRDRGGAPPQRDLLRRSGGQLGVQGRPARDRGGGGAELSPTRTQVAIVGAGPAGLLLGHLLGRQGIESVVIEARDREYVQQRVRAGVLEQGTVELLVEAGVGKRLQREGLVHEGLELRFGGRAHRIDLSGLTGGRAITIYGQQEVVKDLIDARLAAGAPLYFEVADVRVSDRRVSFGDSNGEHVLECDFVAGCDGFHGVTRGSIPDGVLSTYEHVYPYAWLGILARVAPSTDELVYCNHERGFALHSLRSA